MTKTKRNLTIAGIAFGVFLVGSVAGFALGKSHAQKSFDNVFTKVDKLPEGAVIIPPHKILSRDFPPRKRAEFRIVAGPSRSGIQSRILYNAYSGETWRIGGYGDKADVWIKLSRPE